MDNSDTIGKLKTHFPLKRNYEGFHIIKQKLDQFVVYMGNKTIQQKEKARI